MAKYSTDVDYALLKEAQDIDFWRYAKENFIAPRFLEDTTYKFGRRRKMLEAICKVLKITPSREQWLFLLSDADRLLCEACAGAGKTTMAQLKMVDAKISRNIPGQQLLALAYNSHAVADMALKHEQVVTMVNRMLPEHHWDTDISCHTFHSFCLAWVRESSHAQKLGIIDTKNLIASETEIRTFMDYAVSFHIKKNPDEKLFISDGHKRAILGLISFAKETLTMDDEEKWKLSPTMSELADVPFSAIKSIIRNYERAKDLHNKMDFADIVDSMFKLCHYKDVMDRLRANYQIMLVDEYQDITPAMLRIIKMFMEGDKASGIEPYHDGQLICIGDGDQSIYGFRGTDPDNCIRFKETYERDGSVVRIVSMSENLRCPSTIIEYARKVIYSNDKRIDKPINAVKPGGKVIVEDYANSNSEIDKIIANLRATPKDKWIDTCIAYRNLSSSYMLTVKLYEDGIPFRFGNGNKPLSDRLSTSILDVFNMIIHPDLTEYMRNGLHKILPKDARYFNKTIINKILDEEDERRKWGDGTRLKFWELPFGNEALSIRGFGEVLQLMQNTYVMMRANRPMKDYCGEIIDKIMLYYLNWLLQKGNSLSSEYIDYVRSIFSSDRTYTELLKYHAAMLKSLDENSGKGVYLTTMHGLKGLEFEHVHIMDLDDGIFPGTELTMNKGLTGEMKDILENEARRLFYVAVTRSKNVLFLYFSEEFPTRYIKFFIEDTEITKTYRNYLSENYTEDGSGFLTLSSDNPDFVKPSPREAVPFSELDFEIAESRTSEFGVTHTDSFGVPASSKPGDANLFGDIEGLDLETTSYDLTSGIANLQTPEAIAEENASTGGIQIGERRAFNKAMTMEEEMVAADRTREDLQATMGGNFEAVASKPGVQSILAAIMEGRN